MDTQEVNIYRGIQKNTEEAIKAGDMLGDKVHDKELTMQISRQNLQYSQLHNEAMKQLVEVNAEPYRGSHFSDIKMKTGLQYHTLLNTSTAHIAELLIKESQGRMLEMEKLLHHNQNGGVVAWTLAKSFLDLEERNVRCLKDYL